MEVHGKGQKDGGKEGVFEGDGFKSMENFSELEKQSEAGPSEGTGDAAFTRKTRIQTVLGGELEERSVTLPDIKLEGLTNDKYHKAAGGSDIPMTYGF